MKSCFILYKFDYQKADSLSGIEGVLVYLLNGKFYLNPGGTLVLPLMCYDGIPFDFNHYTLRSIFVLPFSIIIDD